MITVEKQHGRDRVTGEYVFSSIKNDRTRILKMLYMYFKRVVKKIGMFESDMPLKEAFSAFEQRETGYMDEVFSCIESAAASLIREKRLADQAPLYRESATYAHEHGERLHTLNRNTYRSQHTKEDPVL